VAGVLAFLRRIFGATPEAAALEAGALALFEQAQDDLLEASRLYDERSAALYEQAKALQDQVYEASKASDDLAGLAHKAAERAERIAALIA
jgi:hypothetical protein